MAKSHIGFPAERPGLLELGSVPVRKPVLSSRPERLWGEAICMRSGQQSRIGP